MNSQPSFRSVRLSQDDVVMGTLPVRENIMFSANLRLPMSYSRAERSDKVDDTIEELGLTACANTKVRTVYFLVESLHSSR